MKLLWALFLCLWFSVPLVSSQTVVVLWVNPWILAQWVSMAALIALGLQWGLSQRHICNGRKKHRQCPPRFCRYVEACLQRRVDACNAWSQRYPSNSAARKMAGWYDWNSVGRALSSWLQWNTVGGLCCNLCKTRRTLLTVQFDTGGNIPGCRYVLCLVRWRVR